ncbi:unnamed protein product [Colias eurytheme]|nr:unnamed protein product [Colias eurytheme]
MGSSEVHCIPASWIIEEDKGSQIVLVAYPDEPWELTRERAKNYENRGKNWTVCLAKIVYITDFYESVTRCVNQREHGLGEFSGFKVITTEVGSPYCSYLTEYQKWLDRLSTVADSDCSMENAMEEDRKVQSDSSESLAVVASDDDTPCDLSMRSSKSRSISETENFTQGVCYPEVIITEAGSSDSPSSSNARQFCGINESNNFWSGFEKRFLNVVKLQHKASSFNINQATEDGADGEVSRDRCINSSEVDEQLAGSSLLKGALIKPRGNDTRWTLKHREYLPGLVELWPNTGVYIMHSELNNCLKWSKKCTQLTRLLTKHVFTESALRKCQYVNIVRDKLADIRTICRLIAQYVTRAQFVIQMTSTYTV